MKTSQEDMAKRWRIHSHDPERIAALSRAAEIPAVVAQLLICRGIHDPRQAREFLDCKLSGLRDPQQLPGVPLAAERLHAAVQEQKRIIVYGDYDVDGVSGTSLLWQCLKLLGGDVGYYVPHRLEEGYGLNCEALQTLASQGAKVVVTVDCGIASVAEAARARELGLELIITDHHEMADALPDAAAIVHPRLPGTSYPFGGLCGAGVAFKLAWALCQCASQSTKVSPRMKDFLLEAVALAALGTVADVVPLVDENRVLVRHGLLSLKESPTLGLTMLMKVAKCDAKPRLTSEDIAFCLAPRINAAGRLGQARLAVELLTTTNSSRAAELAEYIDQLNNSRQSLERSILLSASKQAQEQFDPENDSALVLADHDWHPGVIGIVAGRLVEKFHRPVILIALDKLGIKPGVGSARSVPGFDLYAALNACTEHLIGHGGHAAAAGLRIADGQIDAFRQAFCDHACGEIASEDRVAELWIDAEAPLSAFTLRSVEQIESLAPFGQGNGRPLLCASHVTLAEPPKRIGNGRHLSLKVVQHGVRMRGVAFGQGDAADELTELGAPLSIAFRPIINEFNGRRTVELHICDWRAAEPVPVG
jgi:single-stranded-DNA-specific exonuclease